MKDNMNKQWTKENKWRNFTEGMKEALCLLQYGKTIKEKQVEDLNPFESMFNQK